MGGVCIGLLSSGKTLITGRILGISGAIKCVLTLDTVLPHEESGYRICHKSDITPSTDGISVSSVLY